MSLLIFLLILSILIVVHEAGHFLTAKRLGVRVEQFALGGYLATTLQLFELSRLSSHHRSGTLPALK